MSVNGAFALIGLVLVAGLAGELLLRLIRWAFDPDRRWWWKERP